MVLLSLKEADLRNPPLALTRLGDIKKLCKALTELRSSLVSQINHSKTSDSDTPPIVLSDEDTSSWLFHPPYVKENSFTLQNGYEYFLLYWVVPRDGVKVVHVVHVHHPSGQKCKIFPKGPPYVLGRSSKIFRAFGAIKFLDLVWSIVIFMFN
jgi:hypothetical protein